MRYYRLYFMDRFSGHIDHFREFEAEDDTAAFAMAEGWREGATKALEQQFAAFVKAAPVTAGHSR